jgi:transcriptional regulator with XRE-family HTH domain
MFHCAETCYIMRYPESSNLLLPSVTIVGQSLGRRLKRLREALADRRGIRFTQSDLAATVGTTKSSVAKWETDAQMPSGPMLVELARILETTPAFLLTGAEEVRSDELWRWGTGDAVLHSVGHGTEGTSLAPGRPAIEMAELWAELPGTTYLQPRAQDRYNSHLLSYLRRHWSREVIIEAARTLVRPLSGANTMWMQGRGKELTEDEQILVIDEMADIVESLVRAKGLGRS